MGKKLFFVLFIFFMCFFAVGSVRAEGHFTVDGKNGKYLTCTYGDEGDAYTFSVVFGYDGDKVSCSDTAVQVNEETWFKKRNLSFKNESGIVDGVEESGKCPTKSVMYVSDGIFIDESPWDGLDHALNGRAVNLWLAYKDATFEKYKSENCDKKCESVKSIGCCVYGKLQKSDVSETKEEAKENGEKVRDETFLGKRFKKEASESVIDKKVILSDDVCGIINGEIEDIIHDIVWFIFIAGVLLAIILGMVDFVSSVVSAKDDSMTKSWRRFIKRIVATAILLLLPLILEFLLTQINVDGISDGDIFCNVDVK